MLISVFRSLERNLLLRTATMNSFELIPLNVKPYRVSTLYTIQHSHIECILLLYYITNVYTCIYNLLKPHFDDIKYYKK